MSNRRGNNWLVDADYDLPELNVIAAVVHKAAPDAKPTASLLEDWRKRARPAAERILAAAEPQSQEDDLNALAAHEDARLRAAKEDPATED